RSATAAFRWTSPRSPGRSRAGFGRAESRRAKSPRAPRIAGTQASHDTKRAGAVDCVPALYLPSGRENECAGGNLTEGFFTRDGKVSVVKSDSTKVGRDFDEEAEFGDCPRCGPGPRFGGPRSRRRGFEERDAAELVSKPRVGLRR